MIFWCIFDGQCCLVALDLAMHIQTSLHTHVHDIYMYMYMAYMYSIRHLLCIKIACASMELWCTINDEHCMYIHVHVFLWNHQTRSQTVICLLVICFINMLRWCWCSAHQYDPDAACFCSSHKIYALLRPINSTSHTHSVVFVFALYPPISLLLVRWTDNYASDSRLQRRKQGLETVTEKKDLINFSDVHVSYVCCCRRTADRIQSEYVARSVSVSVTSHPFFSPC